MWLSVWPVMTYSPTCMTVCLTSNDIQPYMWLSVWPVMTYSPTCMTVWPVMTYSHTCMTVWPVMTYRITCTHNTVSVSHTNAHTLNPYFFLILFNSFLLCKSNDSLNVGPLLKVIEEEKEWLLVLEPIWEHSGQLASPRWMCRRKGVDPIVSISPCWSKCGLLFCLGCTKKWNL